VHQAQHLRSLINDILDLSRTANLSGSAVGIPPLLVRSSDFRRLRLTKLPGYKQGGERGA
jgi:hypothetical protein